MKKNYVAPEVEYVSFTMAETIASDDLELQGLGPSYNPGMDDDIFG